LVPVQIHSIEREGPTLPVEDGVVNSPGVVLLCSFPVENVENSPKTAFFEKLLAFYLAGNYSQGFNTLARIR
jgi:hypothetical protein